MLVSAFVKVYFAHPQQTWFCCWSLAFLSFLFIWYKDYSKMVLLTVVIELQCCYQSQETIEGLKLLLCHDTKHRNTNNSVCFTDSLHWQQTQVIVQSPTCKSCVVRYGTRSYYLNYLSVSNHIRDVISKCAQSLFAFKVLRCHRMNNKALEQVYKAAVIEKLLYTRRHLGWDSLRVQINSASKLLSDVACATVSIGLATQRRRNWQKSATTTFSATY